VLYPVVYLMNNLINHLQCKAVNLPQRALQAIILASGSKIHLCPLTLVLRLLTPMNKNVPMTESARYLMQRKVGLIVLLVTSLTVGVVLPKLHNCPILFLILDLTSLTLLFQPLNNSLFANLHLETNLLQLHLCGNLIISPVVHWHFQALQMSLGIPMRTIFKTRNPKE